MDLFNPAPVAWIQTTLGPDWVEIARIVSALGATWGMILVAGLAHWIWGRRALYVVLAVLLVEAILKKVVAALVWVPRPEEPFVITYDDVEGVSSFPSGHTSSATAPWAALAFLRRIRLWAAVAVGALVGLSRLYLGVHFVVDVVAAIALGVLVAWGVVRLHGPLVDRMAGASDSAWGGIGLATVGGAVLGAMVLVGDRPDEWATLGFLAGLGLSIPVERRWVGYRGPSDTRAPAPLRCVVGVAGIVPFYLIAGASRDALELQGIATCGATLWALLGAPALFAGRWRGHARTRRS